jgi:murein DD-endopeptidase MepM/ murein hydrolase activator NlpD
MNQRYIGMISVSVVLIAVILFFALNSRNQSPSELNDIEISEVVKVAPEIPEMRFGIETKNYEAIEGKIRRNQTIADILLPYNISRKQIFELDKASKKVFSVRKLVVNKKYTLLYSVDSVKTAAYFIYEPNNLEYVVYSLIDGLDIYKEQREVEIVERTMSGLITVSLDHSIRQQGGGAALVSRVADVFGWQIDFRSLQRNDWFKVIYEDKIVNGESIGVGEVISAEFSHIKNSYMAYAYDDGEGLDYYDDQGESLQKAFLRYPVDFSRISSRYNPNRVHPVLKSRRPHLGTDFAAVKGTPIKAAADGIITTRGYTRANGNWIKIKHNGTYTTGYLHMSKLGNFKQGQRVKKGDVIGYVGKTGLATGYHLCFRFWKRGKQVDFLNERTLPSENPISADQLPKFSAFIELQNKKIDDIPKEWADRSISASANQ